MENGVPEHAIFFICLSPYQSLILSLVQWRIGIFQR